MQRDYDGTITAHYRSVAEQQGLSPSSTMADEGIRTRETTAMLAAAAEARTIQGGGPLNVVDVGCGNGYTLERLSRADTAARFTGIEYTPELRALALSRFAGSARVVIEPGDIRDAGFAQGRQFDLLLCQRVIINLLDADDQKRARDNLVAAVRPGGFLAFLEAFSGPLEHLNEARREFALPDLPPAHHNLYLTEDFFAHPALTAHTSPSLPAPNFLSSHYFVSRVLHEILLDGKPFKRNSHLVSFLSQALPPAVGDYAPVRFVMFRKA